MPKTDSERAALYGFDPNSKPEPKTDEERAELYGYTPKLSGRKQTEIAKKTARSELIAENQLPGLPLNIDDGAPLMERAKAAFRKDDPDQTLDYWKNLYGEDGARYLSDGSIAVITTNQKTGEPFELRVDEFNPSMKDLADIADVAPMLAGDALAFALMKRVTGTGYVARSLQSGAAAIGGQLAGAGSEMLADVLDDQSVEVAEILKKRGKMAAIDYVLNLTGALALTGAGKGSAFVLDAFGKERGFAQKELVEAINYIEKKTGHKIDTTAAQATGDPKLARLEALIANVPGGQEKFLEFKQLQQEMVERVQRHLVGKDEVMSQEDVYKGVWKSLREKLDTVDERVALSQEDTLRLATGEIFQEFDQLSLADRALNVTKHADFVKAGVQDAEKTFEKIRRQKYGKVYSHPEANQELFSLRPLAKEAQSIKKGLIEKTIVDEVDTGILTATGKPITTAKTRRVPSKAFVPKGFLSKLDEIIDLKSEKTTLNKMVQARRMINDAVKQGEVLEGLDARNLKKMSHAITVEIDRVTDKMPNGQLKQDLLNANGFYKSEFKKFLEHGVAELALDTIEPGAANHIKFVKGIYQNPDAYRNIRAVLGKNSNQFKAVKRVIFDGLLQDAGVSRVAGGYVDGKALDNAIRALEKTGGSEMVEDLFGKQLAKNLKSAINGAWAAKLSREGIKGDPTLRVPLRQIIEETNRNQGPPSVKRLRQLFDDQDELAELYRNKVIADVVGMAKTTNIDPSEFVENFVMGASNVDFRKVMGIIGRHNPDLIDDIRAKAVQNYFMRAEGMRSSSELLRHIKIAKQDPMTADSMLRALGTENQIKNFTDLVGDETVDLIKQMSKVKAVIRNTDDIGGIAGGLLGGAIMNNMFRDPVTAAFHMWKYRIASRLLTSKAGRAVLKGSPKWARRVKNAHDFAGASWILTQPAISALRDEFPKETEFMQAIDFAKEWWNTDEIMSEQGDN